MFAHLRDLGYVDSVRTGSKLVVLAEDILDVLPASVDPAVLLASIRHVAGSPLTVDVIDRMCWRLAGNLPRLRLYKPVDPWTTQVVPEWVPVQCSQVHRRRSSTGKLGYSVTMHILAGTPCGLAMSKFWSDKFCKFFAPTLGFAKWPAKDTSARIPTCQFNHPTEFVSLRFQALVHPDMCTYSSPGFTKLSMTPSLLDHNKELLKLRDRVAPGFVCPIGKRREQLCYRCHVGYINCPAGCHRQDYVTRQCTSCNTQAPFDTEASESLCLLCHNRRMMST